MNALHGIAHDVQTIEKCDKIITSRRKTFGASLRESDAVADARLPRQYLGALDRRRVVVDPEELCRTPLLSPSGRPESLTEIELANEIVLPQLPRRSAFEGD